MLSFAYPWIFLLAPLPWLVWAVLPPRRTTDAAVRVPFGSRLKDTAKGVTATAKTRGIFQQFFLPSLVWLLTLSALARPQRTDPPIEKNQPTRDMLLLVDLSGSMDQEDFTNAAGNSVDRLTAVKDIVGEFLQKREGDRVGLVVFGDTPFLQAPFSVDLSLSRQLLEETAVGMAGPQTALGDAIGLGINLFDSSEAPAKTIIALTDGNDTKSQVPPVEASRIAAERGIRIHTVAIGDPTTVGEDKLDEVTLQKVAKETGGKSYFAGNREELAGIYEELDEIETREVKTVSYRPRHDLFQVPLLLALLVSLLSRISFHREPKLARADRQPLRVDPATGQLKVT